MGGGATAPRTPASAAGAEEGAKLPLKEKRPTPATKATTKSTTPARGSEAKSSSSSPSSSSADLLKRFPVHNKPFVEITGDDAAWLIARGVVALDARRTKVSRGRSHIAGARSFPWGERHRRARDRVRRARDRSIRSCCTAPAATARTRTCWGRSCLEANFDNLLSSTRGGWPGLAETHGGKSATGPES